MIYHITTQKEWQKAQTKGVYISTGFAQDGFIHCSEVHQVADTANRFYAGAPDLVVLEIDTDKLSARLEYENLEGGEMLFPHLYSTLPISAVAGTFTFQKDTDGKFLLPDSMQP